VPKPIMVTPQTPLEDLPQFLTVEEWRTFIRIGRSSAYDLIRQGLVPVVRWGRTVRISREVVMRFVDQEGQPGNNNAPGGQAGGGHSKHAAKNNMLPHPRSIRRAASWC
jgi:excisionase family DNA binding protein